MAHELLGELRRLGRRELRLTLAGLTPGEREQTLALLASEDRDETPSFKTFVSMSPWLLRAVDRARSSGQAEAPAMTAATRAALSEALRALDGREGPGEPAPRKRARGLAGLFARRGSRTAAA